MTTVNEGMDILDMAVERIANDDYNHVSEAVLRRRLALIRGTHIETHLEEAADVFIAAVRHELVGRLSDLRQAHPEDVGKGRPCSNCLVNAIGGRDYGV